MVYGLSFCAYLVSTIVPSSWNRWASGLLLLGWLGHLAVIVLDSFALMPGHGGMRFGFAPVISVTVWLVLGVYWTEARLLPVSKYRRILAGLGALSVLVLSLYPGDASPHSHSAWMAGHWLFSIVAYGLFGIALLHGILLSHAEQKLREKRSQSSLLSATAGMPLLQLERLTFGLIGAGFFMLTLGLGVGMIFSNNWSWSHKTVLSLMSWSVFAALLAGRYAFGWRGTHALRWLYGGILLLLLAYVGTRFVFEVILHRLPVS
jgi:ABC-type uncharacterized transport system permease subunit